MYRSVAARPRRRVARLARPAAVAMLPSSQSLHFRDGAPRLLSAQAVRMRINGQVERLPPISRIRLDSEFEPNELNAVERWSNGTRWPTLGPSVPLRIVALGMSVTAGCGSSEPSHQERVALLANRNGKAWEPRCKFVGSWSRILHAELSRLLEAAMLPHQLRMSVVPQQW